MHDINAAYCTELRCVLNDINDDINAWNVFGRSLLRITILIKIDIMIGLCFF